MSATAGNATRGWSFYKVPGPNFAGTDIGTDFHYYNWVDQFNTLGLGENVPIANGSSSDSLLALLPESEEWVVMRVPYPQGFHSRGLDGRIDDPDGGWKGARPLRHLRRRRRLARRGRTGRAGQPGEVPDSAAPAGELAGIWTTVGGRRCPAILAGEAARRPLATPVPGVRRPVPATRS